MRLWPGGTLVEGIPAVAPRLAGCAPRGVPMDAGGFVETDPLGRVTGLEHVYAAGDCTAFPVKHASLAAGQADAAAATIAGAPEPFDPVLCWVLPGSPQWYVEAPLAGGKGEATRVATASGWSASACFGSRHLTPLLGRARGPRARATRRSSRSCARSAGSPPLAAGEDGEDLLGVRSVVHRGGFRAYRRMHARPRGATLGSCRVLTTTTSSAGTRWTRSTSTWRTPRAIRS